MMSALELLVSAALESECERVLIALDGRAASGKTTLADAFEKRLDCNVFHLDDFFLRPEQRSPERLLTPGENVDHERFVVEVMMPLLSGKEFSYRPFSCSTMTLGDPVAVTPKRINLIEGAYACHPSLFDAYTHRFFLTVSPEEQLFRIAQRNASSLEAFKSRWIPLEEAYFKAYDLMSRTVVIKNENNR